MSDGIMATSLSPETGLDKDMSAVFNVFAKASNAIVEASNLRKEVNAMKEEMQQLRDAYEIAEAAKRDIEDHLERTTNALSYERELRGEFEKEAGLQASRVAELERDAKAKREKMKEILGLAELEAIAIEAQTEAPKPEPIVNPPSDWKTPETSTLPSQTIESPPPVEPPKPVVEHWDPKRDEDRSGARDYLF